MADQTLSTMNVVFTAKGMEEIAAAIDSALAQLQGLRDVFGAVGQTAQQAIGEQTGKALSEMQTSLAGVQDAVGDTQDQMTAFQAGVLSVRDAIQRTFAGDGEEAGRGFAGVLTTLLDWTEQYRAEVEGVGKKLLEWLGVKGVDAAKGLGDEQQKAGERTKGLKGELQGLAGTLQQVAAGVQNLGTLTVVSLGFQAARSIEGYVRAGLAASAVGQTLNMQFQQLNMVVAGLFGPELRKLVQTVAQLTEWLRKLSDEQREGIARWIMAGAAALAFVAIVPKVITGIQALIANLYALATAQGAATGGIVPLIGMVATAVAAIGVGTEVGRKGFLGLWGAAQPLLKSLWGLVQQLGEAFKPVAAFASAAFGVVASTLQAVMPHIRQAVGIIGEALQHAFSAVAPMMLHFGDIWSGLVKTVAGLLPVVAQIGAATLRLVTVLIQAWEAFGATLYGVYAKVAEGGAALASTLAGYLIPVIDGVTYGIKVLGGAVIVLAEAVQEVGTWLVEVARSVYDAILPAIQAFWQAVVAGAGPVVGFLQTLAQTMLSIFGPIIKGIGEAFDVLAKKFDATIAKLSKPLPKLDFKLSGDGDQRGQLPMAGGGFEGVESHWERLARASIMATAGVKSPEDKMLEIGEKQLEEQKEIKKAIEAQKPAVRG